MALRAFRLKRHRGARGLDAALEKRFAIAFRGVPAEPVPRPRQLPGRLVVLRVLLEACLPDGGGLARAGDVLALGVERIGVATSAPEL
jgi:hypothetical protein